MVLPRRKQVPLYHNAFFDTGLRRIDERWTGLRNALAGHFCASLGALDVQRTSSPLSAFPLSFPHSTPHALRYASLPSEHVCTENLTPFVKLLPCKTRAGLATLLTPQRIFDADWHGLSVHVQSTQRGVELKLGVQAVFDPVRLSGGIRRGLSHEYLMLMRYAEANKIGLSECCLIASSTRRVPWQARAWFTFRSRMTICTNYHRQLRWMKASSPCTI